MEKELKILLLEENYSDAELLMRTLTKADMKYDLHLVESKDHFISELDYFNPMLSFPIIHCQASAH
jgi:hypothetical protein